MSRIYVDAFQPFPSRIGKDTVLRLRFNYDAELVEYLKRSLRVARSRYNSGNVGGWLPEEHCWFVEWKAWPEVKEWLEIVGHDVVELTEAQP